MKFLVQCAVCKWQKVYNGSPRAAGWMLLREAFAHQRSHDKEYEREERKNES
jgi:hypothetical protein